MPLAEIDALEVLVIIDNEIDLFSAYPDLDIKISGQMLDICMRAPLPDRSRGEASNELRMDKICCGAHGLSLMITAIKDEQRHSVLFDTGPEENVWELNANRLNPDLSAIELIHLSHWHRNHSGGMLRAIHMIKEAKEHNGKIQGGLTVDVHPDRPEYRGIMGSVPISLEADPKFEEMQVAGASVSKNSNTHTVLDDMFLISGEIPRVTPYEKGLARSIRFNSSTRAWERDEMIADERFMMCNVKGKGIVVFTGCSHAGVINVSKHAVDLAGSSVPLHAVVGGYHLVGLNESQIQETVDDFKRLNPKILIAGHCSGWRLKHELENQMPGRVVHSGVGLKFAL